MKFHPLKITRIIFALLIFLPLLFFLIDFTDIFPKSFHVLAHIQLVPAILAGSFGILIFLTILTLLFGRIYCSVICPMGIMQDVISWFTKRGQKKNKKKRWYHYSKPYNILRYSLLAICVISLIFGILTPILFLDPYSNFGRIAVNIFRPIAMEGNNLMNWIALKFDNYSLYHVTLYTVTTASFIISLITLLIVGAMSLLRGRLFCNTICPVGSLLGLLSRFAIFRIVLDESKCTSCGLCERACKAECISSKGKSVDYSRCVSCFNCLDRCDKFKAIGFKNVYAAKKLEKQSVEEFKIVEKKGVEIEAINDNKYPLSRRSFLMTGTAMAATIPFIPAWAQKKEVDITKLTPITPPGSRSLKHFKEKCTACHLCITHCPQQILKPAGFNFGIDYAFKPHLVFYEMAFCNFECTACIKVCPNHAIERITVEEKKVTQIGIAKLEENLCIVITENTSCGACSEHCPTQAVKMEPYKDGLTLPHVTEELCVGCGGCESICPVRPIKAINVLANEVHKKSTKPEEEEMLEIDQDELDFGF